MIMPAVDWMIPVPAHVSTIVSAVRMVPVDSSEGVMRPVTGPVVNCIVPVSMVIPSHHPPVRERRFGEGD